jgi:pSer/pThr/pTyr-binding forkhead associated (FHA) protein
LASPRNQVIQTDKPIFTFGRKGCVANDFQIPGDNAVSRRHCLIVNYKHDVWLYDLGSTGTRVNDLLVKGKVPLVGLNTIRIAGLEYNVAADTDKLL